MIIMLGDIHAGFANVMWTIKTKKITDCVFIQVGDFGIGPQVNTAETILKDIDQFLKQYNVIMYVIRGNHDDPAFFKGNHIYPNLKLLPDYTQLEIDGHNILFVGGAVSVDRKNSLNKMQEAASYGINKPLYWFDEAFVLDEEKLKTIKGVDMVVTHTAPEWAPPDNRNGFGDFVMMFAENDPELLDDLKMERYLVTQLFHSLKENGNQIKKHYYGHFHKNDYYVNGMTEHIMLGVGEMVVVDDYRNDDDYEKILNQKYE